MKAKARQPFDPNPAVGQMSVYDINEICRHALDRFGHELALGLQHTGLEHIPASLDGIADAINRLAEAVEALAPGGEAE